MPVLIEHYPGSPGGSGNLGTIEYRTDVPDFQPAPEREAEPVVERGVAPAGCGKRMAVEVIVCYHERTLVLHLGRRHLEQSA